ncbi:ZIP family metal transporter [Candidatus Micrarchaeota archaeon]|nr:ZIP family metal transporter [Candidatus Micrarchaeota archaeon]
MAIVDVTLGAFVMLAATAAGSSIVLLFRCMSNKMRAALLAFSGGVMGYTAIEMLVQSHQNAGDATLLAGLALGILALFAIDRFLPHIHAHFRKSDMAAAKKKTYLLAGTIMLHNIPEGFAVASAFAGSLGLGWLVTASIALQDIPEGLLVAMPLACYGMSTRKSFFYGIFSGVVEFAAAIIGFLLLSMLLFAIPFALAFSSGAMIYVVLVELLPDAFEKGFERMGALCFVLGAAAAFAMAALFAA